MTSLWLIYFISGKLYLSIPFTYSIHPPPYTLPQPTSRPQQPVVGFLYLWVCFICGLFFRFHIYLRIQTNKQFIHCGWISLCVCAKSLQLFLTFCDPMDCSPPGSSIHEILQAGTLEVGYHFLLQGIFLTQRLNPCLLCLLAWQAGSLLASPGKPRFPYKGVQFGAWNHWTLV